MTDNRKAIVNRIKTLRGHLEGIEKMVEEGRHCEEILVQVNAVKSSINRIGIAVLDNFAKECAVSRENGSVSLDDFDKVVDTILKYARK